MKRTGKSLVLSMFFLILLATLGATSQIGLPDSTTTPPIASTAEDASAFERGKPSPAATDLTKVATSSIELNLETYIQERAPHLAGFESLVGSAEHGKVLFDQLSCSSCHSIQAREKIVGPSLAGLATRLSSEQLLTSVVEPSREIATGFASVVIQTPEGLVVKGKEVERTATHIKVRIGEEVSTFQLNEVEVTPVRSEMPENIAEQIESPQDFSDLLTFLKTLN